jgi:anti-sigma regulatory factor (Ser/Thr protein kinase)
VTVPGVGAPPLSALHAIQDQLHVSTVRLRATAMGRAHGLDAAAAERLSIVVTELATNIARHAGTGHIVLRPVGEYETGSIEILALDKGPGIADMGRAMRKGGLAGIKQVADVFDIYSQVGRGTAVVAHVGAQTGQSATRCYAESVIHECLGVVCVPLDGEEECGDAWAVDVVPGRLTALLVDGLGHGPGAAAAALAAMSAFRAAAAEAPEIMLCSLHTALRATRGAALSVTVVDQSRRTARFCGVGNVDGRVVTADTDRHLIPQNGIVGHAMPRTKAADVAWPTDARLVMHSDGISSRWHTDRYPGLLARHPALLAGVLYRDWARARDDATVLVLREPVPAPSE